MRIAAVAAVLLALAGEARAHKNINFRVEGPFETQYRVTSEAGGVRTGTMPAAGFVDSTVFGYEPHDGRETIRNTFWDAIGAVVCDPVPVGLSEPAFHFAVSCKPTFRYNGAARTCASSCEAGAPPGPPGPGESDAEPVAYPNPMVGKTHEAMRFQNLPSSARVRIYTSTGRLVYEGASRGDGSMHWHCQDSTGRHVGSGVYHVVAEGSGKVVRLKIAVQR